jgi:hypothetical protein
MVSDLLEDDAMAIGPRRRSPASSSRRSRSCSAHRGSTASYRVCRPQWAVRRSRSASPIARAQHSSSSSSPRVAGRPARTRCLASPISTLWPRHALQKHHFRCRACLAQPLCFRVLLRRPPRPRTVHRREALTSSSCGTLSRSSRTTPAASRYSAQAYFSWRGARLAHTARHVSCSCGV